MNRIDGLFQALATRKRAALIPFISAGDPTPALSQELLNQLPSMGADLIELGMPFSDPTADGPIIQKAHVRALRNNLSIKTIFTMIQTFRSYNSHTPLVLMGYANPILAFGIDAFFQQAHKSGADGVILVDVPIEEDATFMSAAERNALCVIRLATPTTSPERLRALLEKARGFVYYVSIAGITGTKSADKKDLTMRLRNLKKHCPLPVAVGFGIKTGADARLVAEHAQGVVIGSALIQAIEDNLSQPQRIVPEVAQKMTEWRKAIEEAQS
ncbi:MAG: tryptophan synthase subunit alpha [Alphaproteobacteria bacterium GM202ARS2]|nr:tryptophan synthase subunit alpha [Alphaproteobacteria bacterium GM202ARS2]